MNFSDPLLVSAGQDADQVRIKLSKNFFLTPQTSAEPPERKLASIEVGDEYIVIEEEIPRQFRSESELISL